MRATTRCDVRTSQPPRCVTERVSDRMNERTDGGITCLDDTKILPAIEALGHLLARGCLVLEEEGRPQPRRVDLKLHVVTEDATAEAEAAARHALDAANGERVAMRAHLVADDCPQWTALGRP